MASPRLILRILTTFSILMVCLQNMNALVNLHGIEQIAALVPYVAALVCLVVGYALSGRRGPKLRIAIRCYTAAALLTLCHPLVASLLWGFQQITSRFLAVFLPVTLPIALLAYIASCLPALDEAYQTRLATDWHIDSNDEPPVDPPPPEDDLPA